MSSTEVPSAMLATWPRSLRNRSLFECNQSGCLLAMAALNRPGGRSHAQGFLEPPRSRPRPLPLGSP
jgi:hypothetical protein